MNQEKLEKVIKNLKGEKLNYINLLNEINKFDKNIKRRNIEIMPGYRINKNSGWVTVRCLTNKIRVIITNDGIVEG